MKKALFYAVRTMTLYPYVVAVTSTKKQRYGRDRWYGRDVRYDSATNGTMNDLRGRFDTQEEAELHVTKIQEIGARYQVLKDELSKQTSKLYYDEREEIEALFKKEE